MTRGGPVEAAAASALVVVGLLLPLTLVGKLQSMGMYLTPFEIVQAYGTSWILHLPIAAVAALGTVSLAACLPARLRGRLTPMLLSAGLLFALYMGARPLLESILGRASVPPGLVAAGVCLVGLAYGWWMPESARGAWPVARLLSVAGMGCAAVALVLAFWPTPAPAAAPRAAQSRPDILLLTIDSFANSHMSSMGYSRPTTPSIDSFASEGAQFSHLVASSNFTTPTLNTLMSGLRPWTHKAFHLKSKPLEDARAASLPSVLQKAGYVLGAVSTNPFGGVNKNGYGQWFDETRSDRQPWLTGCSDLYSRILPYACAATEIGILDQLAFRTNLLLHRIGYWPPGRHYDARIALADAQDIWTRKAVGRPRFLWVHLMPPHDPYLAPVGFVGRFDPSERARDLESSRPLFHFAFASQQAEHAVLQARYDESLASLDAEVGAFLGRLRSAGLLDNTVVIVSADHGESFRSDYGGHGGPRLHGAVTRIPLIMVAPEIPAGLRLNEPVEQADIPATIADFAGAAIPPSWEGRSLRPMTQGQQLDPRPIFSASLERSSRFGRLQTASVTLTEGRWTYEFFRGFPDQPGFRDLRDGLYDNETDSEHLRNLSGQNPERSALMKARILRELAHRGGE